MLTLFDYFSFCLITSCICQSKNWLQFAKQYTYIENLFAHGIAVGGHLEECINRFHSHHIVCIVALLQEKSNEIDFPRNFW